MAAHIASHRDELTHDLRRYDGLYTPEDWLWSALRPLPRAWLPGDGGMVAVDFAFWDGTQAIAIDLTGGQSAAGVTTYRITPDMLATDQLLAALPDAFQLFWNDETLPRSPFRRAIPLGVLA